MCGIVGIYGLGNVVETIWSLMIDMQHRGQQSAGITTCNNNRFIAKKGNGLVNAVFETEHLNSLAGNIGLGHVRYGTSGSNSISEAQPFFSDTLMLVHNGNLVNQSELIAKIHSLGHYPTDIYTDSEALLYLLDYEINKQAHFSRIGPEQIFHAVENVMFQAHGSYSVIAYIKDKGMFAFRDPHGIKPLFAGRRAEADGSFSFVFVSEQRTLHNYGYELWGDLGPGQAILIPPDKKPIIRKINEQEHRPCIFEYVYFAMDDSTIDDYCVNSIRREWGILLAEAFKKEFPDLEFDLVSEVPETSKEAALGFSSYFGGNRYRPIFISNKYVPRSFISEDDKSRRRIADMKLNVLRHIVNGKVVVLVEDSIIRGNTASTIIKKVREAGAKKVIFASYSPSVRFPCYFGIDMQSEREFIAAKEDNDCERIANKIGADIVFYLPYELFRKPLQKLNCCDACFTGRYPIYVSEDAMKSMELQRRSVM